MTGTSQAHHSKKNIKPKSRALQTHVVAMYSHQGAVSGTCGTSSKCELLLFIFVFYLMF